VILPSDVIEGSSRQNLDIPVFLHVFGHPATVKFSASANLLTVSLDDKSDFHLRT
jgi:hypothetical protein